MSHPTAASISHLGILPKSKNPPRISNRTNPLVAGDHLQQDPARPCLPSGLLLPFSPSLPSLSHPVLSLSLVSSHRSRSAMEHGQSSFLDARADQAPTSHGDAPPSPSLLDLVPRRKTPSSSGPRRPPLLPPRRRCITREPRPWLPLLQIKASAGGSAPSQRSRRDPANLPMLRRPGPVPGRRSRACSRLCFGREELVRHC